MSNEVCCLRMHRPAAWRGKAVLAEDLGNGQTEVILHSIPRDEHGTTGNVRENVFLVPTDQVRWYS
jgi:hypothetical protein